MSKERELLGRWHNGDLLPEEYMKLMKETKELLAQPEQEPVAWLYDYDCTTWVKLKEPDLPNMHHSVTNIKPLYTSPPKREPIEDGELEVRYSQHAWAMDKQEYMWGFRDAEKAHGITGGGE